MKTNCRSDICVTSGGNQNSIIALKGSEKSGGERPHFFLLWCAPHLPNPPTSAVVFFVCSHICVIWNPKESGLAWLPWEAVLPFVTCQFPDTSYLWRIVPFLLSHHIPLWHKVGVFISVFCPFSLVGFCCYILICHLVISTFYHFCCWGSHFLSAKPPWIA